LNRILASVARRDDVPQNTCGAPEGWQELRVQVAQRAFAAGCHLSPDDIIITSGCMEALSLSLHAVCRPGDVVAVESPTYYGILESVLKFVYPASKRNIR
jgi:DNA-binding transcriptional MocR family regulator